MLALPIEEQNKIIAQLPVVIEIKEEVHQVKGEIQDTNKRLDKGAKRMDGIEDEMRKGFKDILEIVAKGNEDRNKKHTQVMDKLDQDKENRLLAKLKERDDELLKRDKKEDKNKDRIWEIVKAISWVVVALFLAKLGLDIPGL